MIRLIVVVEGQTEEAFVKVLKPHLDQRQIYTSVTIVGKLVARRRNNRERGGGHFRHWKRDIQHILENDTSGDLRVTTLFDLYGLPDDFPTIGLHERVSDCTDVPCWKSRWQQSLRIGDSYRTFSGTSSKPWFWLHSMHSKTYSTRKKTWKVFAPCVEPLVRFLPKI